MATAQDYFKAAARAHAAGDFDAARRLVRAAQAAQEAPESRLSPLDEPLRPEVPPVEFQPRTEVEEAIEEQVETVAEGAAQTRLTPPGITAEDVEREIEARERRRIERSRARVPTSGSAEPEQADDPLLPMFRPTRIRETPGGRFYVDPDTGEVRKPTVTEEVIESFARQQVLSEEEARERSVAWATRWTRTATPWTSLIRASFCRACGRRWASPRP